MDRKEIRCEIDKLAELVEGWNASGKVPALERDLALEKLRRLYEAIRFCSADAEPAETDGAWGAASPQAASETVSAPIPDAPFVEEPVLPQPAPEESETLAAGELLDLNELLAIGMEPDMVAGDPALETETAAAVPEAEPAAEPAPAPEIEPEPAAVPEAFHEAEPVVEPASDHTPEPAAVPEASVVFDPAPASDTAPVPASETAPIPDAAPAAPVVSEPAAPAPAAEPKPTHADPTLFGLDDETLRHRHKQRVIMSLYDTQPEKPEVSLRKEHSADAGAVRPVEPSFAESRFGAHAAPSVVPESEPSTDDTIAGEASVTPADMPVAAGTVLGDVINHDVQTLADKIAPHRDAASELRLQEPVDDLRKAIGINDKFLLIRDLFGGDRVAYDRAVDALNACESLDDCMIYIAEHYAWNPDSDGVRLLMELLERKFA
ncbi:MAG TPA: hypothetical protein H9879_01015 [Candidatus Alistipes intestinipullorum]|nr:hypothetical protein [Candidatus Alistipes intestinipullorum]